MSWFHISLLTTSTVLTSIQRKRRIIHFCGLCVRKTRRERNLVGVFLADFLSSRVKFSPVRLMLYLRPLAKMKRYLCRYLSFNWGSVMLRVHLFVLVVRPRIRNWSRALSLCVCVCQLCGFLFFLKVLISTFGLKYKKGCVHVLALYAWYLLLPGGLTYCTCLSLWTCSSPFWILAVLTELCWLGTLARYIFCTWKIVSCRPRWCVLKFAVCVEWVIHYCLMRYWFAQDRCWCN